MKKMQLTIRQAQEFLTEHYRSIITDVEQLSGGEWSQAFAFKHDGKDYILRVSKSEDDFLIDKFANRFRSQKLSIPKIVELGSAFNGYYAVSERAFGTMIDDLDKNAMKRIIPSLFATLDAIREAKKIIEWVAQGQVEIDAVARINISLEALVKRAKTEGNVSDDVIRNDYYLWRKSAREVDSELAPTSKANFELDGDADPNGILADFLANFYMTAKPTNMYKKEASAKLETKYGTFTLSVYQSKVDFSYHLALVKGNVTGKKGVLTRVHSSCITGDILFSKHCDCGEQLQLALETINREGEGVLFYLFQEGRGINIINKIKAYDLQRGGMDTVDANLALGLPAEMRQYEMVREMLDDLGVESIRLLSNNPDKSRKLRKLGVAVESTVNLEAAPNEVNKRYLSAKRDRMGHLLNNIT